MSRLPPQLGRASTRVLRILRPWGLPGAAGAVLLAIGLLLAGVAVPQARSALTSEAQALHDARLDAARIRRRLGTPAADVDPVARYTAAFPDESERHRRVARLLELAGEAGVESRRSELRLLPERDLGLARVRVVLPLTARYESLRRYIERALREDPALALDLLRIERSDGRAGEVRAELQWSLWMRADRKPSSREER